MSADISASLRLDISDLQEKLARSERDAAKLREKMQSESQRSASAVDAITAAHKRLEAAGLRTQQLFAPKAVNPWTTNAAAAAQYAQIVETKVVPALQKQSTWQARTGDSLDTNRMLSQQAAQTAASRGRGGRGAGGGFQLGGMAMQAQDIAVQLQMGTRASIVLAQQGSQLLSIFGPGGALLGGAIAIGGAFYMMGEKASEAFTKAKKDVGEFDAKLSAAMTGNSMQLADFWGQMSAGVQASVAELESLNQGWSAIGAHIADIFGGPAKGEREVVANEMRIKQENAIITLQKQLVETSAAEVEIAQLRAAGEVDKADAMQRQLDLAREIARIQGMSLPQDVKDTLIGDAKAKSAAEAVKKPRDLTAEKDKIRQIETQIKDETTAALGPVERHVELAKQQEEIFTAMQQQGGQFYAASIEGLQAWSEAKAKMGDTAGQLKVLQMLQQALDLQKQMEAAAAEAAKERDKRDADSDAKRQDIEATKEQMAAEQERFSQKYKAQQAYMQSLREEAAMLQAKLAGNDALVERMERELRIRERAKQIQEQAGGSAEQARRSAERMIALEDQASRREASKSAANEDGEEKRGRIRLRRGQTPDRRLGESLSGRRLGESLSGRRLGESIARPGESIMGRSAPLSEGGGLDGFWRTQRGEQGLLKDRGPSGLNQLYSTPVGGGPEAATITGRAMQNADAQNARETRDTSSLDLGSKIFQLLARNLE